MSLPSDLNVETPDVKSPGVSTFVSKHPFSFGLMTRQSNGLFVFDTNIVVSGLLFPNSKPAQALLKAQAFGFVVCSETTYNELTDVLLRPKFDKYLSRQSREQFLIDYRNTVLLVDIIHVVNDCQDATFVITDTAASDATIHRPKLSVFVRDRVNHQVGVNQLHSSSRKGSLRSRVSCT